MIFEWNVYTLLGLEVLVYNEESMDGYWITSRSVWKPRVRAP